MELQRQTMLPYLQRSLLSWGIENFVMIGTREHASVIVLDRKISDPGQNTSDVGWVLISPFNHDNFKLLAIVQVQILKWPDHSVLKYCVDGLTHITEILSQTTLIFQLMKNENTSPSLSLFGVKRWLRSLAI